MLHTIVVLVARLITFVIPTTLDDVGEANRRYPVVQDSRWGFIDEEGDDVVLTQFHRVAPFVEGLAMVCVGECWSSYNGFMSKGDPRFGFIDASGRYVIKPNFAWARSFSEGLAAAAVYDLYDGIGSDIEYQLSAWGYLDRTGAFTLAPVYEEAGPFRDGLAPVRIDSYELDHESAYAGTWFYIDREGERRFGPFHAAWPYSEGLAAIALDEEWGFIDTEGRFFVEPQFEEVRSFAEGFATVRADEEWLLLDRSGKRRRVPGLEDPVSVSEGLLPVAVDGRIGFADPNGKLVIAPRFDMAQGFSEGIAAAADQGRWGYINRSGEWIILPRFETACAFMDGRAAVVLPSPHEKDEFSNHEGVVDARGRLKLVVDYPDQERDEAVNSVEWMPFDRGMLSRLAYIDQSGRIVWEGSK